MKVNIFLIILVAVTGITFGQKTKMFTFENNEKCKILEIKNLSGAFNTEIKQGGLYLEMNKGIFFANVCYKNGGTIYGNPTNYSLKDDILTLEIPRQKAWNTSGTPDAFIIILQLSKNDLLIFNTFAVNIK